MAIGKGVDKQPNADVKSREETISEFLEFADGLAEEAKKITDTDEEVERLKRKIKSLRTDIEGLKQLNEKKFKTRIEKLTESISLLVKEVKFAIDGVADWQIRRKEKEIKDLQARAALEDMEFTKFKEHYFDAEGRLGDFVNFIKKYNLEAGKEESVENLGRLLNELKTLLDNKNYKDFTTKYDGFKYIVSGLLAKAYDEKTEQEEAPKTTEPAKDTEPPTVAPVAAPAAPEATPQATLADLLKLKGSQKESQKQRKAKGVVATKLAPSLGLRKDSAPDAGAEEKEDKEQDKRNQDYEKAKSNLNLLESIITNGGKNNAALRRFAAEFKEADSSLRVADKTELPEIFARNLKNIEEEIEKILAKGGPSLKNAYESQKAGVARPVEPAKNEPTPAGREMTAEQKKIRDHRKRLCDDRWIEVMSLAKIIRGTDYESGLKVVEGLLLKVYGSLDSDDIEDFDKNNAEFSDAWEKFRDGLGPDIREKFERGGVKKATEPEKNEPTAKTEGKKERLLGNLKRELFKLGWSIEQEVKNKPVGYFAEDIDKLKEYLKNAETAEATNNGRDFNKNVINFEKLARKLGRKIEDAIVQPAAAASPESQPSAPLSPEPVVPVEPLPKKRVRVKKERPTPAVFAETPAATVAPSSATETAKPLERKRRILDISERDLLEIVGEKKLQEVVSEIILGNADVAKVLLKDIFSRKDTDLEHLNNVLEKFNYTPAQFMKEWAETLHVRAFEVAKQWVEQMSRNWLNKNVSWWEKLKANPMAHAKLAAVNILPFAALGGSIGVLVATGGASHAARGAVVGGATGLLRGLKAKVGSVRGWFEKRKEKAREEIAAGGEKIKEDKALPLRDGLLAQFTGDNGPEMMKQLSAMLSQSLRDASAAGIKNEAIAKVKSGAEIAVEEITERIDVEFEAMKKSAGEETAKEVQRIQTERAETLIKKLYEDKDLEALIQKLIERDPKIVSTLQGLKINNLEFGKFIKGEDKDPDKKESNARKVAAVLASVAAGASIGGALAAAPELRAVLGAVVGGYLGVKYGHLKDRRAREAQFAKEFNDSVAKAEKVIDEWEKRQVRDPSLEPTPENIKELAERAKDLRAPLNLGMLDGDINLKLRSQNALRRLESLQINLYINQNPGAEEQPVPEAQRNRGVERLLTGLNAELEELTKHQQNIEQKILRKPGWWRAVGYGVVGAVAGAGLGYGTAKAQEYLHGHHKQVAHPTGEEGAQHQQIAQGESKISDFDAREHRATFKPHELAREQTHSLDHVIQKELVTLDHNELHEIDVVTLEDHQGVLSGAYQLRQAHPELFIHDDGTAWTNAEIHKWNVEELKAMGGKYIEGELVDGKPTDGKWVMPFETHGPKHGEPLIEKVIDKVTGKVVDKPTGARVGLYTDENGRPHFKLASEDHVTIKKYYDVGRLQGADKHVYNVVDTGAVAGREGDYLINPYADGQTESAITHTPIKVDANIREMAIVHHAPKVSESVSKGGEINNQKSASENIAPAKGAAATPEKTPVAPEPYAEAPINHLLTERGTNPKEFISTFQSMRSEMAKRLDDSLVYAEGSDKVISDKVIIGNIHRLYDLQQNYIGALENGLKISDADLQQIDKLISAENLYKSGKSGWVESLGKAVFGKDDDKVMQLAFASHTNYSSHPILTNDSHAVRIWSASQKKDVFWYEKNATFNLNKKGNLILKNASGQRVIAKKDALRMVSE